MRADSERVAHLIFNLRRADSRNGVLRFGSHTVLTQKTCQDWIEYFTASANSEIPPVSPLRAQ